MEEPVRHVRFDATLVRRIRRLTPAEKLRLGSDLSEDALWFARKGGRRPWRPVRSNAS